MFLTKNTTVLVQGITGTQGRFHTKSMLDYGTKIVAGVTPGKGGSTYLNIPIYNTVHDALSHHPEVNTTILFVPAKFCRNAVLEAINSGIPLIVIITEGIPLLDSLEIVHRAQQNRSYIIGPNCPGIITPKLKCKVGIMPADFFPTGTVGIVSRSGTLSYEIALNIQKAGFGISTAIGIGGDPIIGPTFIDVLDKFERDPHTSHIILIGEIGGKQEELAAQYIKDYISKPVLAYIAGRTITLKGKRFGHAGALISTTGVGTAQHKVEALELAGIPVANSPTQIQFLLKKFQ
ncbi:MAG: succinate--CoA ligase subunit alpha [Candidatus Helarchaeota archaeon]